MQPLEPIPLDDIIAARDRISGIALRTPLIRLNADMAADIYLKLENLQPIGSFKLRGAGNALLKIDRAALQKGVYTASAGNMAQGLAWNAKRLGIPCQVVVPEQAPQTKIDAIERLGAGIIKVPFDEWWQVIVTHQYAGLDALFIHPVSNPDVIAGNATIGLEILEDLPTVDRVLVPYGGRQSTDEITLFKSLGLAVEDLAAAHFVYNRALEAGGGVPVELGGRTNAAA